MSIDVTAEITIQRPRPDVARYAMDAANDPVWIGGITRAALVTEPPIQLGSRVEREARFLGRKIEYVNEVVALAPEARMVMQSVVAPFPMTVTYEFEDADEATTRARIRVQGEGGGFYRLARPLLARAVRRSIAKDLASLKAILERSGRASRPS